MVEWADIPSSLIELLPALVGGETLLAVARRARGAYFAFRSGTRMPIAMPIVLDVAAVTQSVACAASWRHENRAVTELDDTIAVARGAPFPSRRPA